MSKEEILEKHSVMILHVDEEFYYKSEVLPAMQEYADQEKEKVAVAFAEWLNQWYDLKTAMAMNRVYTHSDLYQYWIENIYNK